MSDFLIECSCRRDFHRMHDILIEGHLREAIKLALAIDEAMELFNI